MECLKCKITGNDLPLSCDGCERKMHTECSDLSASELKVMSLRGKRLLKFYCEDCLTGVRLVPKLIKKIDELRSEVEQLKLQVEKESCSSFSEERVINEINERQTRMSNVMIFNLPESNSQNSDLNAVKDIVREVAQEDLHINKIFRVGKKNKSGNRALKVIFSKTEDANKLIRSKKDILKDRKIFINADLTPLQLNNWQNMKKEVEDRRTKGENVTIRYHKGVPQISKAAAKK